MGDEIAQSNEWNYADSINWSLLEYNAHKSVQAVVRDCAKLYLQDEKLAQNDFNPIGFSWINADDANYSAYSFLRYCTDGKTAYAIICNFTPVKREAYGVGLPFEGVWKEVLNTDTECYCGSGTGKLPPLSTIVLRYR